MGPSDRPSVAVRPGGVEDTARAAPTIRPAGDITEARVNSACHLDEKWQAEYFVRLGSSRTGRTAGAVGPSMAAAERAVPSTAGVAAADPSDPARCHPSSRDRGCRSRRRGGDRRGRTRPPSCCPTRDPSSHRGTSGRSGREPRVEPGRYRRPAPTQRVPSRRTVQRSLRFSWIVSRHVYRERCCPRYLLVCCRQLADRL
jgi:hypothetical protein